MSLVTHTRDSIYVVCRIFVDRPKRMFSFFLQRSAWVSSGCVLRVTVFRCSLYNVRFDYRSAYSSVFCYVSMWWRVLYKHQLRAVGRQYDKIYGSGSDGYEEFLFLDITPYSSLKCNLLFGGIFLLHFQSRKIKQAINQSRAIAHAVSRWLPTAAARVRARVWSSGICGGQSGAGASFLWVLWFPLPIFIPPNSPSSQSPRAGTIGQKWPTCRVDPVWTPPPPPSSQYANLNFFLELETNMKWVVSRTLVHAGVLLGLFFDPDGGGDMFLRKVGWVSTYCTVLYPRR
jgi:hypothetical protein